MGLKLSFSDVLVCLLVLLPALCSSQDPFEHSRATFYRTQDGLGTPSGACGYGAYGQRINDGHVSGVSRALFGYGTGCGACYQVKCTIPNSCTNDGIEIIVTDRGEGHGTDFILSPGGFEALALPNKASELKAEGEIEIEYRRIPCKYPGKKLELKIHEHSNFPEYLAIVILFQGGQKDILALDICQVNSKRWMRMRKSYGAVWDMENPPKGNLKVRLVVADNGKVDLVELMKVLPGEWKVGEAYNFDFQFD